MIKRILIGVTGGAALPAKIAMSLDLARRHSARLQVLSVVDVERLTRIGPVPIGASLYAKRMGDAWVRQSHALDERAIAAFETAAGEAGVDLQVLRAEADPLDALIAAWRSADLCLLGARGWFDEGVMPEPEDALLKLVAAGVRPILAVPEKPREIGRVLVAYNGSLDSAKAMKRFVQLRLWPAARLEIVSVGAAKTGEPVAPMLAAAAAYCRDHGFETATRQLEGDVTDSLLARAAESRADLIVHGSSFRTILLLQRFGGHAVQLLKRSPVPLFLSH